MLQTIKKNPIIWSLSVLFAFGFGFHLYPPSQSWVIELTESFLFIINILLLGFLINKNRNPIFIVWITGTLLITFLVELAGVHTGQIFGSYQYGDTMKWKLASVPVIIAINWVMLILASYSLAGNYSLNPIQRVVLGAVFIVIFDLFLEPVAMKLDYWQWKDNIVPTENYGSWFVIAFIMMHLLSILKIEFKEKQLEGYFVIQLIFFIFLGIFFTKY